MKRKTNQSSIIKARNHINMKDVMKDFGSGKMDLKSFIICKDSSVIKYGNYLYDRSNSVQNFEFLSLGCCSKDFNFQVMLSVINQSHKEISKLVQFIILKKFFDLDDIDDSKFCCSNTWWDIRKLFVGPASVVSALVRINRQWNIYLSEEQMEKILYFTTLYVFYATKLKLNGFLSFSSLESFLNGIAAYNTEKNNINEKILKYFLEFVDMENDKKYLKIIMKYNLKLY